MTAGWYGRTPDPERDRLERELRTAELERDAYRAALALLRPYMKGTGRTLGEALDAMRADGIEPGPLPPLPEPPMT